MTLEEKFEDVALVYGKSLNIVKTNVSIAEKFAIDFGQWLLNQPYRVKYNDKEELLEIYKKTL